MAIPYLVKLSLTVTPVYHSRPIPVTIGIDKNLTSINLDQTTTINYEFLSMNSCQLIVELPNKQGQEAVIIDAVSFFDIEDPKFAWAGVYKPCYPEPWATEQQSQGISLKSELCPHTYLGWPGQWTLTFDVPVFTWMHKIQNLGWIYS